MNITQPITPIRVIVRAHDWPITRGGGGICTKQPSCSWKKLQDELKHKQNPYKGYNNLRYC